MAEKLKGLTIGLDLDTLKVNSGLTDLRSKLRLVNSEMRSNLSAFDRSDRTIGKYETTLSTLNKKIEVQTQITEKARNHYEKMVATHGEGSVEAEKAAAAYNRQSAELQSLERYAQRTADQLRTLQREQAETNSIFYKSGESIIQFSDNLGSISDKAKSVGSDLTKYLTTPIMGLVTLVGGMGFKRAMSLEQVEFMMDHISDSAAEYEKRMATVVDLVTDTRFGTAEIGNEFAKLLGAGAADESAKIFNEVAMNLATFKSDDSLIQRIGDIFAKALGSGKIDGTMRNQFTDAGVDIAKILGNKWGKSVEDVKEILREGDFDIEKVLYELSEGVLAGTDGVNGATKAMGGMLEGSGRLLSGQIKNFFAAVSQTGERLIKETGLFDSVKDSLDELRNMLKSGELDSVLIPTFQGLQKALEALVETARKIFKWFSSLDDSTKELIGKLVGLAAVIGPVLVGLGTFGGIIAKILKPIGTFFKWIAKQKALAQFGKVAKDGTKSVGLLSRAFTFLSGPAGIVIGIISILIGAFTIAYKKSETFRGFIHDLGNTLKDVFVNIKDYLRPGIDAIVKFFDEIKEKFKQFMKSDGDQLLEAFRNIGTGIKVTLEYIWEMIKVVFGWIKEFLVFIWPTIEAVIKQAWEGIKTTISGVVDVILGIVKVFSGIFTGDFSKVWEGIKDIFTGAAKAVWGVLKTLFIDKIIEGIVDLGTFLGDKFSEMWNGITGWFTKGTDEAKSKWNEWTTGLVESIMAFVADMKIFFEPFVEFISEIFTNINNIASEMWVIFKNVIIGTVLLLINLLTGDFEEFKNNLIAIWENIKESVSNIVSILIEMIVNITVTALELFTNMKDWLMELFTNLVTWLITKIIELKDKFIQTVTELIKNGIEKFTEFKAKSIQAIIDIATTVPVKLKELKDGFINHISKMISDGVTKFKEFKKDVKDNVAETKDNIIDTLKNIDLKQIGKDIIDGLIKGLKSKVTAVGEAVKEVTSQITGKLKSILKIASPSKVMEQFGKWTGEGVEIGIVKSVKGVGEAAARLAGAAIPKRTNTAKQLALYGKRMEDETTFNINGDNEYLKMIVEYLSEQVSDTKEMIYLLMQILAKEFNVSLDSDEITKKLGPKMSKEIERLNKKSSRKGGVVT